MASIEEGRTCRHDNDCSVKQYCYEVSGRCVDYTLCKRYNREEAESYSRHPSQCGPCIPGHTAELLGTGEEELLCKKLANPDSYLDTTTDDNVNTIWITSCVILCFIALSVLGIIFKRRSRSGRNDSLKECNEVCLYGPSAPPQENSPFIGFGGRMNSPQSNNNRNLKDMNTLVTATPSKEPNWIRTNPNYPHGLSSENLNEPDSANPSVEQPDEEDAAGGSWNQGQLAIEMPSAAEFTNENRDNAMNAILIQRNFAHDSSHQESNDSGPMPESSNSHDGRDRARTSNVVINQKITMNLNVLNGDC